LPSHYVASVRTTPQKTPLPRNGYMRTHIESISCNSGFIVACLYWGVA
jgi:hypothetical protein